MADASSITKTQSCESGGVEYWVPELAKFPIGVVWPSLRLNHQQFAVLLALEILLIFTAMVDAFRFHRQLHRHSIRTTLGVRRVVDCA